MSSPEPNSNAAKSPAAGTEQSAAAGIDYSDIANYESFMNSLVTFMNECAFTIQQVKERSGISPACSAPVRMNDEEKQQKMKDILMNLSETCKAEASTLSSSTDESAYRTALDTTMNESDYESAHNTAFIAPSSPSPYRRIATSTPCPCPRDISQNLTPPSRYAPRGRRADTPRPGTSPVRGRVASPDQYFVPLTQSSINSPSDCPALRPLSPSGSGSRGRGRSQSPYSTLIDSGGLPDAYRSGTGAFDNLTSQSGRGLSSYINNTSSGWGGECPRDCTVASINSTGRQQYRTLKGPQSNWDWKPENRTI